MITAQNPDKYVMLGNQIPLILTTNLYLSATGAKAVGEITFTAHPANGATFTLAWENGDLEAVFTVLNIPGASAFELTRLSGMTVNDWVQTILLPQLQANPLLIKHFNITLAQAGVIRLAAKEYGSLYTLTMPTAPAGISFANIATGIDREYDIELKVMMQAYYRKLTQPDWQLLEFVVSPNLGETRFLLDRIFSTDDVTLPLPQIDSLQPLDVSTGVLEFKMRYTEVFGQTLVANRLAPLQPALHYAFAGGMRDEHHADIDLTTQFTNYNNWLTWLPDQIDIGPDQPFFLNWFTPDAGDELTLGCTIRYEDETEEYKNLYSIFNGDQHRVWCCPVSLEVIAAVANPAKQILSYTVYWYEAVIGGDPGRSTEITFTIDNRPYKDTRYLLYRNSWGFFEVARLTGEVERVAEMATGEIQRQLPFNYTKEDRSGRNFGSTYRFADTVSSGHRSKQNIELIMEVLRSEDVRLIEGTTARPIILVADSRPLYSTESDGINGVTFKIMDQSTGKYFSNGRFSS